MYADDTSILNVGQDMNELQNTTSNNMGVVEQYFEINNLSINPSETHYILFQTRQCRQESNLKILEKNREISNVKSTDFLGVAIDSNLSWEIHIVRTCSRISHNLFIINRLSKILDLNERKILYYGLIYPLLSYGIVVWGHANTTRIFALQKRAVRCTAGLKHLESCRNSFRNLKILTVYSLYILETVLYVKKKV
jgi:hypothetical protein